MKTVIALFAALLISPQLAAEQATVAPAPNGITIPEGYENWRLIAISQRTESQTLRAILGNSIAIEAARQGKTNPWPNGTILAKLNWKQKASDKFATAVIPGEFIHADFMIKDSQKYVATGGWGYARWLGQQQQPYGKDASFAAECQGCHSAVQDQDFVFTTAVKLP